MITAAAFFTTSASVETFTGAGASGDQYAAAVTVAGHLDDALLRVQQSAGEQVVGRAVFIADIADAAKFTPQSRVTVDGDVHQVTEVRRREGGALFAAIAHVEVVLT